MSLRLRLTLIYLIIAVSAVGGLGVAAYLAVRNSTLDSLDRSLQADVRAVEASFEHLGGPITADDVEESRLALDRQAVQGVVFLVRGLDGKVLYASAGDSAFQGTTSGDRPPGTTTIQTAGRRTRALIQPVVRYGSIVGTIEVHASLTEADASIGTMRDVMIGGGILAVFLSGSVAYVVAGHAASPVVALSALAGEIEKTADFTRRLPEQTSSREMKEMAATFNRMIERVEQMIQSQRHFLSDTSHELRRPLTILRTDIEVLSEPELTQEDVAGVQEEMRIAATNMSSLLTELLILARQDEDRLELEPVEITEVCRSVCQHLAREHPRHSYELHLPRPVWVSGDRQRLERMILNVLHNAATYTEGSGVIACSVTAQHDRASIVIKDNGPGMTSAEQERAFDRFYRGSDGRRLRPEGTGLGLPIVRQVASSHGGVAFVTSRPGRGTTVTIELPTIAAPAPMPALATY